MTPRKPPNVSVPDWVERQIRTATANGAFENLPGAGKPIPNLDRPQDDLAWIANYLKRENVDVTGLLPPGLALAKEVESLPMRLLGERTELHARRVIEDLNGRILRALAAPQVGPPLRVRTVRVEAAVTQWRADRAALAEAAAAARAEAAAAAVPANSVRRRGWRRRVVISCVD